MKRQILIPLFLALTIFFTFPGCEKEETNKEEPIENWRFETGNSIGSSPAIGSDGTIYVTSDDDRLYAINSDGSQKWEFEVGDRISSLQLD